MPLVVATVTELLVPRPEHAVNASPAALFRAVSAPEGPPTTLFDEIDTVFGPKAKDNEDIRGMLNAGHRWEATALRCLMRGQSAELERASRRTRSCLGRWSSRFAAGPGRAGRAVPVPATQGRGPRFRDRLLAWAESIQPTIDWPDMPEGVEDRAADVWEALLACADAAGGDWPRRASVAPVSLVTQASEGVQTLGVQLLRDIKTVLFSAKFTDSDHITVPSLVEELCVVEESPWGDLRGKALDARGLARRLKPYGITPKVFRVGEAAHRGYARADFVDAWARYVPGAPSRDDVTGETTKQGCRGCGDPLDPMWREAGKHPDCEVAGDRRTARPRP